MALFERISELEIGQSGGKGILIKDLRFSFNIEKTSSETLNNSKVKIYNLNRESRKLIEIPNNVVILRAGYVQDSGAIQIFTGSVRRALTSREGVDWITDIELDDGLLAYRDSKVSISFAPGVTGRNVLANIASRFNLPVKTLPNDIPNKQYPSGFSFVGRVRDGMTKVCDYLGLEWSIQNQEVQVMKKGGTLRNTAILISPDSGLIGSPTLEAKTMTDKDAAKRGINTDMKGVIKRTSEKDDGIKQRLEIQGFKVKTLLQPSLQCGQIVKLKAEGVDDFLKIEKLNHVGDYYGSDWYTELSLRFI